MGKERRKRGNKGKTPRSSDGSVTAEVAPDSRRRRRDGVRPGPRWLHAKRPVLRFVVLFGVFMGLYQLACMTAFVRETAFPAYLRLNAQASGAVIGLFEDSLTVSGQSIRSPRYSLVIERGCDAIEPSALFLAGVLAFPATFRLKVPGMLLGTVCLMVLNLVRIISLFYVGVFFKEAFHVIHVDVWQSLFIFLAILFWIIWAIRASRGAGARPHAAATRSQINLRIAAAHSSAKISVGGTQGHLSRRQNSLMGT